MENIFETGQLLLIDKPYRWTSAMAVRKVRDLVDAKVGHAGTLDPLATGLLILCTGKFTKKIDTYMKQEKEYTGTFTLGATTPTYDLEKEPEHFKDTSYITQSLLDDTARRYTGEIEQVPPAYSAIKKNGVRAYELARQGVAEHWRPVKSRSLISKWMAVICRSYPSAWFVPRVPIYAVLPMTSGKRSVVVHT